MRISDWSSDVCSSDLDRARISDPGQSFERHRDMRVRWVRIAAQRVDDEQVDALEKVDHLDGKLRKIGGIGDLVRTVAEDQARRLDRDRTSTRLNSRH